MFIIINLYFSYHLFTFSSSFIDLFLHHCRKPMLINWYDHNETPLQRWKCGTMKGTHYIEGYFVYIGELRIWDWTARWRRRHKIVGFVECPCQPKFTTLFSETENSIFFYDSVKFLHFMKILYQKERRYIVNTYKVSN